MTTFTEDVLSEMRPTAVCGMERIRQQVPSSEWDEVLGQITTGGPPSAVVNALRKRFGIAVGVGFIRRHREGRCRTCRRPS